MHFEGKHGRIEYRIVQPDDEIPDSVKELLAERRKFHPPVSFEQMKAELELEVILYALQQLYEQGVIPHMMYENAVPIALKKWKKEMNERGLQ